MNGKNILTRRRITALIMSVVMLSTILSMGAAFMEFDVHEIPGDYVSTVEDVDVNETPDGESGSGDLVSPELVLPDDETLDSGNAEDGNIEDEGTVYPLTGYVSIFFPEDNDPYANGIFFINGVFSDVIDYEIEIEDEEPAEGEELIEIEEVAEIEVLVEGEVFIASEDIGAIELLYGVFARDENAEYAAVHIIDDGGFDIGAVYPYNIFTVIYSATHPHTYEQFTRERTVIVVIPIMPLTQVFDWEELRAAIAAAGTTPALIELMVPEILTGAGVVGEMHGGGANSILIEAGQHITLINGQADANSRVNLVRNISNGAMPPLETPNWGHENNRRSHELFAIEGILHIGMVNPPTPQANNITLSNNVRRVAWATSIWGHNSVAYGPSIAGGQMRGGVRVRGADAHLHIYNGVIIEYGRHEDEGGNMRVTHGATFTMHGGTIRRGFGDAAGGAGAAGGVFVAGTNSHFIMHNGIIEENELSLNVRGGGVAIAGGAVFTMYGGTIRNHTLFNNSTGAGVAVGFFNGTSTAGLGGAPNAALTGTFNMHGGIIEGGQATFNGGGVWVNTGAYFNMTAGTIRNNRAGVAADGTFVSTTANGGGVYTMRANLTNINIGNVGNIDTNTQIIFYGNRSSAHGGSPLLLNVGVEVARNDLPNIRWINWLTAHNTGTTSVGIGPGEAPIHLVNNWDINVTTLTPYTILRIITIEDGGTGANMVSTDPILPINTTGTRLFLLTGGNGTVNAGMRSGYTFTHWTTVNTITGENITVPGLTGSTNPIANLTNMPAFNVTATAHWVYGEYRYIRMYYVVGDGATNPKMTNYPTGYMYRVGDIFSVNDRAVDRNALPGNTVYVFNGWRVYVGANYHATYLLELNRGVLNGGQFVVPAASTNYNERITLVAVWTINEPPPPVVYGGTTLPATGIEGNIMLWSALLSIVTFIATGIVVLLVTNKTKVNRLKWTNIGL